MPVSPADFEFYSRMTGQPIPNTAAGRMAIAPQVYNMRRGGGGFGRVLANAARGAVAAGALAGAGALALATGEEMAKEGTAAEEKKTPNKRAQLSMPQPPTMTSEMVAPAREQSDKQYFDPGSGEELYGVPDARKKREVKAFLANRISHQTQVPVASPEVANESLAAQRASTQVPTDPRVGVRQQPSTGQLVTDSSNVAAKDYIQPSRMAAVTPGFKDLGIEQRQFDYGPVQKATDPVEIAGLQSVELHDATPQGSPFQDPESFEIARREGIAARQDIKAGNKPFLREYISLPGTNYEGIEFYPEEVGEGGISAAKVTFKSNPDQQYTYQVSPQGLETLKNVAYGGQQIGESGTKFMKGMMSRGELIDPVKALLQSSAPEQASPETASPFVSKKGREIGALLSRAEEKKAAAPTLKEIAGDALNLLNPFKGKKIDPREQQIRSDVNRSLGALSPEQKEAEVRRRLGQ